MAEIEPGSKVKVTVTSTKLSEGAAKTLARLFLKDPAIAKSRRRGRKPVEVRTRAGRPWPVIQRGNVATRPRKGDSCELVCTLDVVRDLGSVERYVEVKSV
jgi:hypothetical protein